MTKSRRWGKVEGNEQKNHSGEKKILRFSHIHQLFSRMPSLKYQLVPRVVGSVSIQTELSIFPRDYLKDGIEMPLLSNFVSLILHISYDFCGWNINETIGLDQKYLLNSSFFYFKARIVAILKFCHLILPLIWGKSILKSTLSLDYVFRNYQWEMN